jgi:ABC-type transport system substrate-binding protein
VQQQKGGGEKTTGLNSTLGSADPTGSYSNEGMVLVNAYETLVRYNPAGGAESVNPVLATSWESNEDATQWTFTLREGVKFHGGNDFNVEAVKYSVSKNVDRGLGASYVWASVEDTEVVDDCTKATRPLTGAAETPGDRRGSRAENGSEEPPSLGATLWGTGNAVLASPDTQG